MPRGWRLSGEFGILRFDQDVNGEGRSLGAVVALRETPLRVSLRSSRRTLVRVTPWGWPAAARIKRRAARRALAGRETQDPVARDSAFAVAGLADGLGLRRVFPAPQSGWRGVRASIHRAACLIGDARGAISPKRAQLA